MKAHGVAALEAPDALDEALLALRNALRGLQFGSIEITVHQGQVVQIERREKVRVGRETA